MHTVVPRIIGLAPGTALPYGGLLTGFRQSLLVTQTRVAQQAQDGEGEGGDQSDHVWAGVNILTIKSFFPAAYSMT